MKRRRKQTTEEDRARTTYAYETNIRYTVTIIIITTAIFVESLYQTPLRSRSSQSIVTKRPSRYLLSFHRHQSLQLKAVADSCHTKLSPAAAAVVAVAAAVVVVAVGTDTATVQEREKHPKHKTKVQLVAAVLVVAAAAAAVAEHLEIA
jgi:hypothetical protein